MMDRDYLILGGGPAGIQLGYYLSRRDRDFSVLERGSTCGGFFEKFPRHRRLISINKVHTGTNNKEVNLRWDWNSLLSEEMSPIFSSYSAEYFPSASDMVNYLRDFVDHHEVQMQFGVDAKRIALEDGKFLLTDRNDRHYSCRKLVVATGLSKQFVPPIPGVELCDTYAEHSIDAALYADKRVLVVGKGNSAFETADHLTPVAAAIHLISPDPVKFAWQTHYVGNLRAVNNNFLDTYQLKSQNAVIDGTVTGIERCGGQLSVSIAYGHARGQTTVRRYDHIILCTGFEFDSEIFDESCRPALMLEDRLPELNCDWESANVPNLYFAGSLMQSRDHGKTMSGFIHGFRHNVAALTRIFDVKYHGMPWPSTEIKADPKSVFEVVQRRINLGPGIFLQPGFLQDVIVVSADGQMVHYYEDVPADYVSERAFAGEDHYYTVSLEYGEFKGDPFGIERDPAPDMGHEAAYLHPVIRRFRAGAMLSEHHIQDDLESEWFEEEYVQPALEYLAASLGE